MSKSFQKKETNPFEDGITANEADAEIYGKVDIPDSGRVVIHPVPINNIWPDLRQPRRAIPTIVRGYWNGDPNEVASVIMKWQEFAEKESHKKLDVNKAIEGKISLTVEEGDGPLYAGFAKLVALAAAIKSEGLTNPITVVKINATQYQVETGERRWLAHHLLAMHINPKKYAKITAREVEYDPFRQASENNSREGYNAIEMARQIAILIMEARRDIDGVKYDRFEDMVLAGECDRKFYAQVANGNIHRIPAGLGDKISNATGLSENRLSQYRRLLRLTEDETYNDEIWIEADTKGYTEHFIRENIIASLKTAKETLTAVKVDGDEQETEVGNFSAFVGKPVIRNLPNGESQPGIITALAGRDGYLMFMGRDGQPIEVHHTWLRPADGTMPDNSPSPTPITSSFNPPQRDAFGRAVTPPPPNPFSKPKDHVNYADFAKSFIGKHVRMSAGNTGKVTGSEGAYVLMVNDGSDLAISFRVTEIIEVLPDPAQHDVTTMNLKGKRVRLRNNIEGVVQDVFGEKIMLLKDGADRPTEAYKSAIASVITGMDEKPKQTDAAPDLTWMIGKHIRHSDPMHAGKAFEVTDVRNRTQIVNVRNKDGVGFTFLAKDVEVITQDNPPSTKQANAGGPLITEAKTLTLVQQIYLLAKLLEEDDAEGSLKLLLDANYSNLQSLRAGLAREDVINVIEQHYNNILVLSNRIMAEVEVVLKDIAAFDAAERLGE